MTTPDRIRIARDRARPRVVQLWWALQPLRSVIRFMQSGAHPDDEMSGMLAALAFREGINLSYACSTRGEGGQNDIGTEAGADLGALRTREMERACDVLGMRMYWHSVSPDDPVTDFGFSKSGEETLGRWGHDRTLARFVEIVRTERPDILCPTFLDVPGQHGHHRAMTQAAHEVMGAAADPAFPSNLSPWQVKKLYLPATSGAGQAYDDDEPPPPVTLTIDGSGGDPVTGWSWNRIGQQSRVFHATQGMGRWVPPGDGADWLLHLAESHVPGPDTSLAAGLPATLADLGNIVPSIADDLVQAQTAIDAAHAAFPDGARICRQAARALAALRAAAAKCPAEAAPQIGHRLAAKEVQLAHVVRLAAGVEARAHVAEAFLTPGRPVPLTLERHPGSAEALDLTLDLPPGWQRGDGSLVAGTVPGDAYRASYDPADPPAPALAVAVTAHGVTATSRIPLEGEPFALPAATATLTPSVAILNQGARTATLAVSDVQPEGAALRLDTPPDWSAPIAEGRVSLTLPDDAPAGLYTLPLHVGGAPATALRRISHPHVAATAGMHPAQLRLRVLDVAVPDARIGYIGAGNDRVDHWLAALGADVTTLDDADLESETALAAFDTVVIGIFAIRFRPGLAEAMPRLHRWVEAGGTLVTLYHRPWDRWDPDTIPPRRLEIGQPSLRWRVTNEAAQVKILSDHPILRTPNRITPADWDGWVKERGLYFAKSWDDAYVPLLEMADPAEAPLRGALLVADVGAGRHVHTSLILHHQMEHLVPGAFRLMANLVAPRT